MKIAIDQKEQQYNEVDLSKTQHLKQVALEDKMLEDLQREIDELKRAMADLLSKLKAQRQKQAQKAKQSENENKKGILKVTVHSVRDLVTYDPEAEKKPYVTLQVLNQIEKTKAKKGATDAEFNEQFEFEYEFDPNQSDSMKIEVWDKDDYASDDKIGGANVNILPFLNNKQDKEIKIQDEYDEPTGIVYQTIEFIPQLQNDKKQQDKERKKEDEAVQQMQDRINKLEDAKDKKMKEAKSLKYVKGKVILSNISVEDLPKIDLIGKCDPYVLLRIGNDEKQTSVAKNTLNHLYEGEEYEMIYEPSIMKGDGNVTLEILPTLQHELDFELYLQPKPDKKKDQSKLKSNLAQSKPDKNNGIIKFTMIYLPEEKQQEKDKDKDNQLKQKD
ncbi:MAG: hypothetical protein EZS28_007491 [Streblomastix strix]|uniref:C2 domain-containing protein n=1 Tax=Streblomastix strix TaxID=222440 RepID=A0A5J4WPS8_9EUKA|nr:MAG: hypothetical protein EZS28_007491 [Streblomastix strix]